MSTMSICSGASCGSPRWAAALPGLTPARTRISWKPVNMSARSKCARASRSPASRKSPIIWAISTATASSRRRAALATTITAVILRTFRNSAPAKRGRGHKRMSNSGFAYPHLFGKNVPPPAPRWPGNAKFNFIGGHNDRSLVPIDELIAATAAALKRDGAELALYSMGQGPQGYLGLRRFVAEKLTRWRSIGATPEDVLITQGSGQAIRLINQ